MVNQNEETWPQILRNVWNIPATALRVVPRVNTGSGYADLAGDANGNLAVVIAAASISVGGGTQYNEGQTAATITGTAILWEDTSDTLRSVSAAKPLPITPGTGAIFNATITTAEATFGTADLQGTNLTSTSAWTLALGTPSNPWRLIEFINDTDQAIQISYDASTRRMTYPAGAGVTRDYFADGLKVSTAIHVRNDGTTPSRGRFYVHGETV